MLIYNLNGIPSTGSCRGHKRIVPCRIIDRTAKPDRLKPAQSSPWPRWDLLKTGRWLSPGSVAMESRQKIYSEIGEKNRSKTDHGKVSDAFAMPPVHQPGMQQGCIDKPGNQ